MQCLEDNSSGHALNVILVADRIVKNIVEHLVGLLQLRMIVSRHTRLLQISLQILSVALELLPIRKHKQSPVPANPKRRTDSQRFIFHWGEIGTYTSAVIGMYGLQEYMELRSSRSL